MFSETDRRLIESLREKEVLKDIRRDLLTNFFSEGALLIGCGDCDRFWEGMDWLRNHTDGVLSQDKWRLQLCVFNGAPLHLSRFGSDEHQLILRQFFQTNELKGIERVIVYGHGPCGAAAMLGLTLEQNFAWTMHAREIVMDELGLRAENVISLFHTDYDREKMRLYKVKRGAWKREVEQNIAIRDGTNSLPM